RVGRRAARPGGGEGGPRRARAGRRPGGDRHRAGAGRRDPGRARRLRRAAPQRLPGGGADREPPLGQPPLQGARRHPHHRHLTTVPPREVTVRRADRLRPSDLAREHGLSAQAVRNYEDDGILPPAPRGEQGYRHYTPVHAQALRAFLALRGGYGHQGAAAILRAANAGDEETVHRLLDRGHAELHRDRAVLDEVVAALAVLGPGDDSAVRAAPSVGALAHQLGVHPATLRKWERAGILHAERDPVTGYRRYPASAVRDAHLARQLRRGGYP